MNEESKKNNKSKTIVMIVLFLTVSSLGVYYMSRKYHNKLDEWREFCKWVETLPYSELILSA